MAIFFININVTAANVQSLSPVLTPEQKGARVEAGSIQRQTRRETKDGAGRARTRKTGWRMVPFHPSHLSFSQLRRQDEQLPALAAGDAEGGAASGPKCLVPSPLRGPLDVLQ